MFSLSCLGTGSCRSTRRWGRSAGIVLVPVVVLLLGAGPNGGFGPRTALGGSPGAVSFNNPAWSADGRHLALTDENANGVYLHDAIGGACLKICDSPSSGYAYNWSRDGNRLGFKWLIPSGEGAMPLQQPVVFDVEKKERVALHAPVPRAGVPSFAADGRIAYTIDRELRIVDASGRLLQAFELDHYANLTPISPDGARVAYVSADGAIQVLDLATGSRTRLTGDNAAYHSPVWSPDGTRLVASTLGGRLMTIEVLAGTVHNIDEGSRASWSSDGKTILYTRTDRIEGARVVRSAVCLAAWDGNTVSVLTQDPAMLAGAAGLSPDGKSLAFVSLGGGELYRAPVVEGQGLNGVDGSKIYTLGSPVKLADAVTAIASWTGSTQTVQAVAQSAAEPTPIPMATQVRVSGTVPYIHQVYDTPNWFDGNWACGATSSMMGITYYGLLPYWDCTVSIPYSHVSHYGRYICETYTYNGYTYNIGSPDASGTTAYGGYGYIVRNNWADTAGYMSDYLVHHGLGSSVDSSPTFAELQTEVNNSKPFVLLNSLTTAGHYILTIGYVQGQYTAIFNDPYGNKNTGYMNYNGAGVLYDWPGYNNGYSNLNTVWSFVYCRGSLTQPPTITQQPSSQSVCPAAVATFTVAATGSGTLTYQWQKNSSNVTDGGHYSGCTTTTLTVSSCNSGDAANHRCVVTNASGSATSNQASLSLKAATTITLHPSSSMVSVGQTAQCSVTATGEGTLSYQWQKNGANVTNGGHYSGATTGTLTVSNCAANDAASYRCVVTGGCGSATSNAATLIVGQPGDFDHDGDVDVEDFSLLQACLGVTDLSQSPTCGQADLNADSVINYQDVTRFIGCMSGSKIPGNVNCSP